MSKKAVIFLTLIVAMIVGVIVLKNTAFGATWFSSISQNRVLLLPLITVSALIDSINPCAFSVLLITIAFLASLGMVRRNIIFVGGAYIIGIFAVYILIGFGILEALYLFNTPHFMAKVGAAVIIGFGVLEILEQIFPKFPIKLKIPQGAHKTIARLMNKASIPGALILGAAVGMFEFPCTGGPYLFVLGLLHDSATKLKGLGYLIYYNLIFVSPLVIILALASDKVLHNKVETWKKTNLGSSKLLMGVGMIALGVLIFLVN